MSTAFDMIKQLLPQLTGGEREDLIKRTKALNSMSPAGPEQETLDAPYESSELDQQILDTITTILRDRGAPCGGPRMLRKSSGYSSFKEKLPPVVTYVDQIGLDRVHKIAFLRLALDLLYQDLTETWTVAIGSRMMMTNIDRIPAVLDKHFPSYAENGMLGFVVRKSEHG